MLCHKEADRTEVEQRGSCLDFLLCRLPLWLIRLIVSAYCVGSDRYMCFGCIIMLEDGVVVITAAATCGNFVMISL